jgi:hypothetical protein
MQIREFEFKTIFLTIASLALSMSLQLSARGDTEVIATTIMACGPLFSIDANADNKTAAQRAVIVQKNLDNALVAAKNKGPNCVGVVMMNHNPVVTLDHYYIVTADENSAIRNGISQAQLAERWADSIRRCLMNTAMVT